MSPHPSAAARQAATLFAAVGALREVATLVPGGRDTALGLVGLADLLVAAAVWVLPWGRWPRWATLVLTVPAFAIIMASSASGLLPPQATAVTFVLVFVWVGSNHGRWASLWVLPLAPVGYVVSVTSSTPGLPFDPRAAAVVAAVCVLVAETVARSQERLRSSEAELRFLAEHTTDLVTRTGTDGVIHYASPSALRLLGWRPEELVGRSIPEFCHPDEVATDMSSPTSDQPTTVVRRIRRQDGGWAWVESVAQLVTGPDGRAEILAAGRDITARRQMESELAHTATHDALTGLPNRVLLDDRLTAALAADRGRPLAVAFLDLDGFKEVNDRHGHEVGDWLLVQVARRLEHVTREPDTVARYGGDEFVLVLDGLPHQRDVIALAGRIEAELTKPYQRDATTLHIGVSVGVTFAGHGMSAADAIAAADRAMYATKAARRVRPPVPALSTTRGGAGP